MCHPLPGAAGVSLKAAKATRAGPWNWRRYSATGTPPDRFVAKQVMDGRQARVLPR